MNRFKDPMSELERQFGSEFLLELDLGVNEDGYIIDAESESILQINGTLIKLDAGAFDVDFNPLRNINLSQKLFAYYISNFATYNNLYISSYYMINHDTIRYMKRYELIYIDNDSEDKKPIKIETAYYMNDAICLLELVTMLNGTFTPERRNTFMHYYDERRLEVEALNRGDNIGTK